MATRFAISSGNFNNTAIWDNGAVPLSTDDIYSNGFNIAVNQNITAVSLRSTIPNVYLPAMPIPAMTGNTQPSGTVNAGSDTTNAWKAFDQEITNATWWTGTGATTGTAWLSYQFPIAKTIKRYFFTSTGGTSFTPRDWTFQGSNDGSTWATLDTVITTQLTTYVSGLLANTTAYLYYRINISAAYAGGTTVYLSRLEMTESTATTYGTGAGGSFAITDSKDVTLSGTQGLFSGSGSVYVLNVNTVSPNVVNINCGTNFLSYLATGEGSAFYLTIAGSGTTNVTGNVFRTMNGILSSVTTGTVNIYGNITSGTRGSTPVGCVILGGSATYNVIGNLSGDVVGTGSSASNNAVTYSGSGVLNITGTISGNLTPACSFGGTGTINISGAITGSSTREAINGGTYFVNILTGIITAGTGNNAIISSSTGATYTLGNSPLINTNTYLAVLAAKIRLYSPASVQWVFQDNLASNKVLYSAGGSIGLPLTTNVRNNIQYGASNELTGTMVVPTNPNVRLGVQVDVQPNVGTADLTAQDIFTAIATSPDPVAERLRNVSTVQTTGDQLAAFL